MIALLFFCFGLWLFFLVFGLTWAKITVTETGLRVQNAYAASTRLVWSDMTAIKTVNVAFFSQYVYLQTKNGIFYLYGQRNIKRIQVF